VTKFTYCVNISVRPKIIASPRSVTLIEGQFLTLFCNTTDQPSLNITWYDMNGNMVWRGDRFNISKVSRNDEGSYQCVASDGTECSNGTAEVNVIVHCK